MKKSFVLMMLIVLSITGNLCAQNNNQITSAHPFYIPPSALLDSFHVQLDKGNSLQIELTNLQDMQSLINMDSIIQKFKKDISPFEDSLSDPFTIKTIHYLTDESGRTFVSLRQRKPHAKNFLLANGKTAAMKIDQDTVKIVQIFPEGNTGSDKENAGKRYILMTFYLNDFHQLFQYENTRLDSALAKIYAAAKTQTHWTPKNNHNLKLTANYSLTEALADKKPIVHPRFRGNTSLALWLGANMQNVYQYIAPSASLGISLEFPKGDVIRQLKLGWEPMFLFAKNDQGVLKTYRNDWLIGEYSIYPLYNNKRYAFTGNFSISYLIGRKGDFFNKNTFRIGLGGVGFSQNRITLQPIIYFHNFFKGVTPGLQLGVSF